MAAPNFVASATAFNADSSDPSIVMPIGAVAGQRALLVLAVTPGSATGDPTGWALVGDTDNDPTTGLPNVWTDSTGKLFVWHAEIGSVTQVDPGATTNLTLTGDSKWAAAILVYDASDVDASTVQGGGGGLASITSPTATASDSARVVHFHGCITSANGAQPTWAPDAATTERVDLTSNHPSSRNGTFCIADETIPAPGTTTARTATPTLNVQRGAAVVVLSTAVTRPVATASTPTPTVTVGTTGLQLNGAAADGGGSGAPYTWSWRNVSGPTTPTLSSATAQNPTVDSALAAGTYVFGLTVTDTGSVESLEDTVTVTVIGAENSSVPIADVTTTGWAKVPSGAATFAETLADGNDGTYIHFVDPSGTEVYEADMSTWNLPEAGEQGFIRYRTSIFQATSGSATVYVKEGASTVIATFGPDAWSQEEVVREFIHELTSEQIGTIVDPTNLRVRIEGMAS